MTMTNPVTNETFDTSEDYIESLARSYIATKKSQHELAQDESDLIAALDKAVGFPDEVTGTFTLSGKQTQVKVTRRVNVSYPKERGKEHPLRHLLGTFPELLTPLINVEYKESGRKIAELLARTEHAGVGSDDERSLADALRAVRVEKPGKPSIEVKEK